MDINQLTANIAVKQIQLEQQINHLQQQLSAATGESAAMLSQELSALEDLHHKLLKSHAMALRAHALQAHQDHDPQHHRRIAGLVLCAFSGLGLLGLIIIAWLL